MNLLALIKPAFTVLYHGQSLANVETWKNAQALTNLGIAGAALVTAFIPGLEIPADMISNIAIAVAGLANWYFTLATSKTVGIKNDELPPIEMQAVPESPTRYIHPDNARWMYQPKVQSDRESTETDPTNSGFNGR